VCMKREEGVGWWCWWWWCGGDFVATSNTNLLVAGNHMHIHTSH
jgi:hypothetical protein